LLLKNIPPSSTQAITDGSSAHHFFVIVFALQPIYPPKIQGGIKELQFLSKNLRQKNWWEATLT
jgi:hypothetical protein